MAREEQAGSIAVKQREHTEDAVCEGASQAA